VRWPDCIGTDWIGGRFNSLEPISTFRVRGQNGRSFKVGVERRGVSIARMRVTPMSVGLPNLDLCVANGLTLQIEHAPHEVPDFPTAEITYGVSRDRRVFQFSLHFQVDTATHVNIRYPPIPEASKNTIRPAHPPAPMQEN